MDKAAFSLFGRDVAWYGILITLGMILAVLYANYVGVKREKLESDLIIDLAFFIIVFGVIGARLYYVIFEWSSYVVKSGSFLSNLTGTLKNIVSVWNGGLAIYGGIIAGLLTAYIFAKIRKVPFIKLFDILAPTVMIGQIIGRWGNFINMEAHGGSTKLPWRMGLLYSRDSSALETGVWDSEMYVHPTFLYESLWNLLGFIILHNVYKKKKFDGQMFAMYLIWYGFGRMLIEGLRTDSLYFGPIRISQFVGFASCILGIAVFLMHHFKAKKTAAEALEYTSVYDKLHSDVPGTASAADAEGTEEQIEQETAETEPGQAEED
ncbi:MAG: prolipoprotein diacylglyceryl transferase [Clostridia bacterium]|nr:prolipoprotein diacylglyceryl transferase [Clostridia bacterium]